MVFFCASDLESELIETGKKFGIETFNGQKCSDIYEQISERCDDIFSDDELRKLAKTNMAKIVEEFGFRGLRVWYHSAKKNLFLKSCMRDEDGWGGDDRIERKYYNLIPTIWEFHNSMMFETDYFLNIMKYFDVLEDVFFEEYGVLWERIWITDPYPRIFHLMKTIHNSGCDENVVKALQFDLKFELECDGDKYYSSLDLTNSDNLEELYLHLCEECNDEDGFKGFEMFYSNDGWGNSVFNKWEDWDTVDDDGRVTHHSKLIPHNHTIEHYKKRGTVWD